MSSVPHFHSSARSPFRKRLARPPFAGFWGLSALSLLLLAIYLGLLFSSRPESAASSVPRLLIPLAAPAETKSFNSFGTPWVIPVNHGVALLTPNRLALGGRLVIGIPTPSSITHHLRLSPLSTQLASNIPSGTEAVPDNPGLRYSPSPLDLEFISTQPSSIALASARSSSLSSRRTFRFPRLASALSESSFTHIESELVASGIRAALYIDRRDRDLPHLSQLADEIIRLTDAEVLPLIESRLCPIADLDGNGRVVILLSSELVRLSPSEQLAAVPLKGMTWSEDFSRTSPRGNASDVVYLHPHLKIDAGLKSLLLHELAHAATFSRAFDKSRSAAATPPDWISEGLAHLAETWENADSSNWHSRLVAFEHSPGDAPLFVDSYSRSGLWRHPPSRGAVISFFQWLERSTPADLISQWFAASTLDLAGLERLLGVPREDLFRRWSVDSARTWSAPLHLDSTQTSLPLRGAAFLVLDVPASSIAVTGWKLELSSETDSELGIKQAAPDLQVTWLPATP